MKFHVLLPIRDEADIIEQCLKQLVTWADTVHVFDTGSCDETWELVNQFAKEYRQVIPLRKDAVYFSEKRLRGWLFHQARRHMKEGDWFVRADADEFHHESPRKFVRERLLRHETVVYHQYYNFHFTTTEFALWNDGKESLSDRARPIEDRRRWYTVAIPSEPRLCRYRDSMCWPETVSFPYNAGYLAVERLPIRHYPHRDPIQMQRRCQLRAAMMTDPENSSAIHWADADWQRYIKASNSSDLQYWQPGMGLPQPCLRNHLAPTMRRLVQRAAHAWCLPMLDALRRDYSTEAYPRKLPVNMIKRLQMELGAQSDRRNADAVSIK